MYYLLISEQNEQFNELFSKCLDDFLRHETRLTIMIFLIDDNIDEIHHFLRDKLSDDGDHAFFFVTLISANIVLAVDGSADSDVIKNLR